MSSTSDESSIVQGNNLLQGHKEADKRKTNTNRVTRRKETLRSTEQVKENKHILWKKILAGSEWKFLLPKINSHSLSTDMEKVPTVLYVKEQGYNRSEYVGFLNPITYWKMKKLYHVASITKTLLDVNKKPNNTTMIKKWKKRERNCKDSNHWR